MINLSDNAVAVFKKHPGYSFQNESIEETFKRVSKEFAANKEEEDLAFNLLASNTWRPNTPVFLNAGTEHRNFCACHVVGLEDSMESIYDVANVSRKIFQYGAGVGIPIGNLREREAYIFEGRPGEVPEGKSSGPITFMRLYDAVGETTKSGGRVRRAAIMISMYCWHPDIMEFIQCKQNEGWLTNMNISVAITDKFMQCLEDKIPFQLYTPYDGSERGKVDPEELWETLSVMSHKTGDPGVLFLDTVQKHNPLKKRFLVESTNPCVAGETLVATPFGYRRADSFSIGETIDTVCGTSEIKEIEINKNLPVYEIEFSDGGFIEVTESHQFHAMKKGKGKKATKKWIPIQLKELEVGDWIRVHPTSLPEFPLEFNSYGLNDYEYGFLVGILIGDGCITEKSQDRKCIKITSNSDDKNWINILKEFLHKVGYNGSNEKHSTNKSFNLVINGESILLNILKELNLKGIANYKRIPKELYRTNREVLKGILDGLFCTDGNVNLSSTHPTLRYSSASRKLIADIRDILLMFGMHCSMGITKKGRTHFYEKEKRVIKGNPKYECIISGASLRKFYDEIHLTRPYKRDRLFKAVKDFSLTGNTWKAKILSIKEKGLANVYDLYEPETDTWITNGYVSRGCGEQPLIPWGVCNLSAINVGKFVTDDEFDWDGLYKTAYNITGLMDNVIDTMEYPDPRFKDTAQKYRQIGIGIMGLADAMYMLNYRYDGPEGKKFAGEVMRTITTASVDRSTEIAQEKEPFYDYEEFKDDVYDILKQQINDRKVLKNVQKYGVRNSQFTTCQPTGCLVSDTLISSDKGLLPISNYKNIITKKLKTKSDFGVSHIKQWYDQGSAKTIKIKTKKGYELQGTHDHKVRVITNGNGYIWKRLDELSNDDFVVLKKNFIIDKATYFDNKRAELLGFYMADGWWTLSDRGHRLYFRINKKEKNYIMNLIYDAFSSSFDINPISREYESSYRIEINSKKLYKWFEKHSCVKNGAENAFIPDIILQGSRELMLSFIKGFLKGDGGITEKNKEATFVTVSKTLAKQLHILLLGLGFPARLREEDSKGKTVIINNREVNCNFNPYRIILTSFYRKQLYDTLGIKTADANRNYERVIIMPHEEHLFPERKTEQGITTVTHNRYCEIIKQKNWFVKNELLLDSVDENEKCEVEQVYDLEVWENTHTYIANGFITHNTTALSCDCSYGIEPIFGLVFEKKIVDGGIMRIANQIFLDRVKDEKWWNDGMVDKIFENGGSLKGIHGIPREIREVFITAHDIKPKDRIDLQASIQKHCSSAISSTINLPKDTTAQEISDLYKYAHKKGLKGLTIYRDGSKRDQPVTFKKTKETILDPQQLLAQMKITRPRRLSGETFTVETGEGKMYVTVNSDNKKPIEVFIEVGKSGQTTKVMSEALGRIVSIAFQHRVPIEEIIKTLKGLDSSNPKWYRFEEDDSRPIQILSIPDGLAQLLERYYINTGKDTIEFLNGSTFSICKKCGVKAYLKTEGCGVCQNCGDSSCT